MSLVSACSALKAVVWMRWSITADDAVDDRDDDEQARPLDALQLAGAQDDELLPVVGHLQRQRDQDGHEHQGAPAQGLALLLFGQSFLTCSSS